MYLHNRLENRNNFFQKIKDIDFILLIGILLLGFISVSTMYSTDGGQILFQGKPEDLVKIKNSYTGEYLEKIISINKSKLKKSA